MFAAMSRPPTRRLRSVLALPALVVCASILGCGGVRPKLCHTTSACGDGEACVIGQCISASSNAPVPANAQRVVVPPESIVFVSSSGEGGRLAAVSLGATVGDRARILLKFPKGD